MSGPDSGHSTGYPAAEWRLIIDETSNTGAWNMALDEAIMEAVSASIAPPTLRFYRWEPPCISLGKRQPISGIALERCRADGVDLVRRATGGLAILHTDELTYSLVTHPEDPRVEGAILDSYRKLSQGLVAGLRRLGVQAEMRPVSAAGSPNASAACFEAPSAYELIACGRKLMGSAQTRPHGRLLQHGSLPLFGDIGRLASYLEFPSETERTALLLQLRRRATTLEAVVGRSVSFREAAAALAEGFTEVLNVRLAPGEPSADELAAARRLAANKELVE